MDKHGKERPQFLHNYQGKTKNPELIYLEMSVGQ